MSNERQRASDVTPDDFETRTVDRWPVEADTFGRWMSNGEFMRFCNREFDLWYTPDPLDDLMAIRGCEGCP